MITHVCFIALTLAMSLGKCLNTRPDGLVLNQLPQDPANVNARKNMCDPYPYMEGIMSKYKSMCPEHGLKSQLSFAVCKKWIIPIALCGQANSL